jgi:hypothetical protein
MQVGIKLGYFGSIIDAPLVKTDLPISTKKCGGK